MHLRRLVPVVESVHSFRTEESCLQIKIYSINMEITICNPAKNYVSLYSGRISIVTVQFS